MNWKKIIIVMSPLVCLFFTACGGGSNDAPPPVPPTMSTANDQAALADLWAQAKKAKEVCINEYSAPFQQIATQYVQAQATALQQAQAGGGITGTPVQPQLPQIPYQPQAIQPQGNECHTQLLNLIMACTTIRESNGGAAYCSRPETQAWLRSQVADIIAGVQRNIEVGSRINILANPPLINALSSQAAYQGQYVIAPTLGGYGSQVGGQIPSYANYNYGGGQTTNTGTGGYFNGLPF